MSSVVEALLEKLNVSGKLSQVLESRGTDLEGDKVLSLDLSELGLKNLPTEAFDGLSDLKKLNLAYNNLTELDPKSFSSLNNLTFLSLFANQLSEVPDALLQSLPELDWLDLRENGLTKVPKAVLELKKLKYLYMQNNPGLTTDKFDFSEDYHSKRDVGKFFEEFQKSTGAASAKETPKSEETTE